MTHIDQPPEADSQDRSALAVIRGLQNGSIDAKSLSVPDRRLCVQHLISEGYSIAEVAEILKVTDRTIARDKAAIRQANSVEASPELLKEMVGALLREAETCISRARRAVRGNDVSAADKIFAERTVWDVMKELVQLLQRLGYLPSAPQHIQAMLSHHITTDDPPPAFTDLEQELLRIEQILLHQPAATETLSIVQEIRELRVDVQKCAIEERVQQIRSAMPEAQERQATTPGEAERIESSVTT